MGGANQTEMGGAIQNEIARGQQAPD